MSTTATRPLSLLSPVVTEAMAVYLPQDVLVYNVYRLESWAQEVANGLLKQRQRATVEHLSEQFEPFSWAVVLPK